MDKVEFFFVFAAFFYLGQTTECVALTSQFCQDYSGLPVPAPGLLDLEAFRKINLQGHSCRGYVNGITSMICYKEIVEAAAKCNISVHAIKKPCRENCLNVYQHLLKDCFSSSDNFVDGLCDDYTSEDCISDGNGLSPHVKSLLTFLTLWVFLWFPLQWSMLFAILVNFVIWYQ